MISGLRGAAFLQSDEHLGRAAQGWFLCDAA